MSWSCCCAKLRACGLAVGQSKFVAPHRDQLERARNLTRRNPDNCHPLPSMRPGALAAGADETPVWVFDRLLGMGVSARALVEHILPAVAAGADELPDATAAKLRLGLLDEDVDMGRVDDTTVEYLQKLSSCEVGPVADQSRVAPPPGLLLKVSGAGERAAGGGRGGCHSSQIPRVPASPGSQGRWCGGVGGAEARGCCHSIPGCRSIPGCTLSPAACASPGFSTCRAALPQVKTELCLQTFRDRPLNVREAEAVIDTVFQGDNTPEDYARWVGCLVG